MAESGEQASILVVRVRGDVEHARHALHGSQQEGKLPGAVRGGRQYTLRIRAANQEQEQGYRPHKSDRWGPRLGGTLEWFHHFGIVVFWPSPATPSWFATATATIRGHTVTVDKGPMTAIDWILFTAFLSYVIWDGLRRSRANHDADDYFLAGRSMPWWAIGLSIMATQASAITLIGTTGKGWADGLRFLQFYFALPIAMIILAFTLVPLYHRLRVSTAYEYLGLRFGLGTRLTSAVIFVMLRGLSLGIVIYAPSVPLTHLLGVDPLWTTLGMGAIALAYTAIGGLRAVIATDVKQMIVMTLGLIVAFVTLATKLPDGVDLSGAWQLAGAVGHLEWIDLRWDPNEKYTLWSSLLGGTLLFLAYFGCDQSQAQRLLASRSVAEARRALFLNAAAKVPFQLLVLSCGVLLFVFYMFTPTPISFVPAATEQAAPAVSAEFEVISQQHDRVLGDIRTLAEGYVENPNEVDAICLRERLGRAAQLRAQAAELRQWPSNDNHAFPHFILAYFPIGLAGILLAAIFAAALSSIDSELNAISTVIVIDILRAPERSQRDDAGMLRLARWTTLGVGVVATGAAVFLGGHQSVIEAVNSVGSLFYGSLLGVFALALLAPRAHGRGAVAGLIAGVVAVAGTDGICAAYDYEFGFLYRNTIGTAATIIVGLVVSRTTASGQRHPEGAQLPTEGDER